MSQKLVSLFAVLALASCGGGSSTSTEGSGEGGGETTGGGETATRPAWDDMTPEQRGQFMAEVVMPEMRTMFQEYDAERYAEFSCATCHGANAHDVGFHMPNGVAPLDPANIPAIFASTEPGAVFMTQRVWPRMGELLGEELYNPETHEGFACLNCHADATATAPAASLPTSHPATVASN